MNKQDYYIYGKVRFIVEEDHCRKTSPSEVRNKINEKHYEMIFKYYGINKEEVNRIINNAIKYTPPSKNRN